MEDIWPIILIALILGDGKVLIIDLNTGDDE